MLGPDQERIEVHPALSTRYHGTTVDRRATISKKQSPRTHAASLEKAAPHGFEVDVMVMTCALCLCTVRQLYPPYGYVLTDFC